MSELDEVGSREALIAWLDRGGRAKYVFFWGHEASQPSELGRWCLSQWYPAEFEIDGVRYPTAEHFMMAEKARLFGDAATERSILSADHPGAAKKAGRGVRGFDEATWAAARMDIVIRGNLAKFGQHSALKKFLLDTHERVLAEASPTDRVWGIGLEEKDPRAAEPSAWLGLNLLGFALMQVRARLSAHD
ncbi:MAG TPA: NADAR family protein [Polyangiales bacterium]|nr:NADAR family protein [Polyangiales bacterium]